MAKGKYAHIIDSLPKWNGGHDPSYQEKINAVKAAMIAEDPTLRQASSIAEKYIEMRFEEDAYDEIMKEFDLRKQAISQLLEAAYEVEGTTSVGLLSGFSVRVQYEPHAKVINKIENRLWAIKSGLENDLVIPWQTLNKLTKDELLLGNPEPDGIVAHAKWKIVMSK